MCTNQKTPPKQCCGDHNTAEFVAYAKAKFAKLGISKEVSISSSGCMGRCALGPVMVVYPNGAWYRYENRDDLDQILEAVLNDEASAEHEIPDGLL